MDGYPKKTEYQMPADEVFLCIEKQSRRLPWDVAKWPKDGPARKQITSSAGPTLKVRTAPAMNPFGCGQDQLRRHPYRSFGPVGRCPFTHSPVYYILSFLLPQPAI